jgi:hypothetical protein
MSKKTSLFLFKNVSVVLFVVAVLFSGIAWGQGGGTISLPTKTVDKVTICSLVLCPGATDYKFLQFNSAPCNQWTVAEEGAFISNPLTDWNGKYSGAGYPLSNLETGGLSFPNSVVIGTIGGLPQTIPFSAANVDKFWKYAMYDGYTEISGADLSKNCHGYSTGVGYWLQAFGRLMKDDYTKYNSIGDLAAGAVYGVNGGHSIKIDEADITGTQYEITTREKYRESGVYERKISPVPDDVAAALAGEVALDIRTLQWKSVTDPTDSVERVDGQGRIKFYGESADPPIDHFYKKN